MPDNGICERFHRTVLDEFYRVVFRKKIYRTAAMSFSFASGSASRKLCIGVLPKHQRP